MINRRIHTSWLLACLSTGIIVGTAAVILLRSNFAGPFWAVVAVALFLAALMRRSKSSLILALMAGGLLGLWRGGLEWQALDAYRQFDGQRVELAGRVTEDVAYTPEGKQQLRLDRVSIEGARLSGKVWASIESSSEIKRGDSVNMAGVVGRGFGGSASTVRQAHLIDVSPGQGDVAREARDWFAGKVRRTVGEPEASLGIGFLTGQRRTLPEDLDNQLRALGLMHIVVASGYNLTILVRLARRLLVKVSKYLAAFSGSLMIVGFILITGLSPSMVRAGLVAGLSLLAWYYGRRIHPMVLLPFAAALTLLFNPAYAWGDIGWYLSFTSFAGVMVLAPLIRDYFWLPGKAGVFKQVLIETVSAQVVTLPIIALVFGQYSPLAIPANLLTLPFIPLAMVLTFAAGFGTLLPAGALLAAPASFVLKYMTSSVRWLSSLPWAQGEIVLNTSKLIVAYLVILLLGIYLWRRTRHDFAKSSVIE